MSALLEIRALGGLTIEINGRPVARFASRKAEALLVYLAHTGTPHSRDVLAEIFWPDRPQERSLSGLRMTLTHLRKNLASYITATRHTIAMNTDSSYWLDVTELLEHLAYAETTGENSSSAAANALARAADLYVGDFLSGFFVRGCPAFEDWARSERDRLRRTMIEALHRLIACHLKQGAFADGITHATRLLTLDPCHEETHRDLMLLLARSGQRAEALAQFVTCRTVLAEELGVEPSAETLELVQSIRDGAVIFAPPLCATRHNLPAQLTPFIGRETEMGQIAEILGQTRLVTLTGPGGIGKTRLALEFAAQQVMQYKHGVFFVSLVAVREPDDIMGAVAEAVSLQRQDDRRPLHQQLLDYLCSKHLLLILDNFEHLLDGATWATTILQRSPEIRVLATSRERLNLMGEVVVPVGGLELPEHDRPNDLLQYSAVQLFFQSAWHQRSNHEPDADGMQHIVQICRLVEGMPLGVLLAATWANMLSLKEIAEELQKGFEFLATEKRDLPRRHSSMRAVFESSWLRLSDSQRDVLMSLSVFRGSFTRHAAQQVTGASLCILSALLDRSLVRREPSTGRYDMHELLRQFAEEQLELSGQATDARHTHADYYLTFIRQRSNDIKGGKQLAALTQIEAEFKNIRAAWYWAAKQHNAVAIDQALEGLYLYCDMKRLWSEGRRLMQTASEHFALPDDDIPSRTWARLQARTIDRRNAEDARLTIEQLLTYAEHRQDKFEMAFCLWLLGHAYVNARDYVSAVSMMEDGLCLFQTLEEPYYQTLLLVDIAFYQTMLNETDTGFNYLQQGLELARTHANQTGMAIAVSFCGTYETLIKGNQQAAKDYFRQARAFHFENNNPSGVAVCDAVMGRIAFLLGDLESADLHLRAAREIVIENNDVDGTANALSLLGLGLLANLENDYAKAKDLCEQSLQLIPYHPSVLVFANLGLAMAACGIRDFDLARETLYQGLSATWRAGMIPLTLFFLPVGAILANHAGESQQAVELLALAYSHPLSSTGWMDCWPLLTHLRADLENVLGLNDFAVAWDRGNCLELSVVVQELLDRC